MYGYEKQDDSKATLCGKIEKESGEINPWKDSIADIYAKYRAYAMWPKIYFVYKEKRVIIEVLQFDEKLFNAQKNKSLIIDDKLHPATQVCIVKPEGSKAQSWSDFIKGYM